MTARSNTLNLSALRKRKMLWCYLFILPQLVMLLSFTIYPIFMSYYYSFFEWPGYGPLEYIGLDNFTETIFEPLFWNAFGNSFTFMICLVAVQVPLALLAALLFNAHWLRGSAFYRQTLTNSAAAAATFGSKNRIISGKKNQVNSWGLTTCFLRHRLFTARHHLHPIDRISINKEEASFMKKGASFILVFALILSMWSAVAVAAEEEMTAQEKFDELKTKGIFTGFPDGTAGLDQEMTRAQFATVVYRILLKQLRGSSQWTALNHIETLNIEELYSHASPPLTPSFGDVPETHWAFEMIEAVYAAGFFVGVGDGRFDPERNVTIQELATAYVRVLDLTPDPDAAVEGAADWAGPSVRAAIDAGLIDADASFREPALRSDLVNASYEVNTIVEPVLELALSMEEGFSAAAINEREVRITTNDGRTFDSPVWSSIAASSISNGTIIWSMEGGELPILRTIAEENPPSPIEHIRSADSWNVEVTLPDGRTFDSFILGEVRDDGTFVLESSGILNEATGAAGAVSLDHLSLVPVTVSLYMAVSARSEGQMAGRYPPMPQRGDIEIQLMLFNGVD